MPNIKKIDHIAIATDDLEATLKFYQEVLGLHCSKIEENMERGLKIAFIPIGNINIEILSSLNENSEIANFLAKKGPGLHHIAFESTNIKEDMSLISAQGPRFLSAQPSLGAHNTQVAFIHPKDSQKVLLELVEHNASQ